MKQASVFLFFVALCLVSLLTGATNISGQGMVSMSHENLLVFTASRVPRLMAIILSGVGLSLCGVILQQIVRNRFVEPYTSGGLDAAKLGILISLTQLPTSSTLGKMVFAVAFSLAASLVFVWIIRQIQFKSAVIVPVIGLMYGSMLSAIAEYYAYQNNMMQNMQGWLLGDFSKIIQGNYEIIYLILPVVILTYVCAYQFTILGMGKSMAGSLGLNYSGIVAVGLILVAITVSATVITVGTIPFIGLIIPNLAAILAGDNLRRTLPMVAIGGASFLLLCDIISRVALHPFEIPIGLTAGSIGGVLFLGIIWKARL